MDTNKKTSPRHVFCGALFSILTVSVVVAAVACTHPVRRLVFQPHKIEHLPAFPKHIPGLEQFWLDAAPGRIEGWLIRGKVAEGEHSGPAVMIAHGNRELIDGYLDRAAAYRRMGFTVLLGEYRGYGRSEGRPSREGIRADYIRFFDKLASLPGVDPGRIVFHGRSLGGAVLADLAAHRRPAAVILESTFTSIKAMAYGAPDFLLSDRYDTLSAMAAYGGPVLIIHGVRDRVVPVEHARELLTTIPQAVPFIDDFGHNDTPPNWEDYWGAIQRFLKSNRLLNVSENP